MCKEKGKEGRKEAKESEENVSMNKKQCGTVGGAADRKESFCFSQRMSQLR